MDADVADTHYIGSGAAMHAHSDNRHGGQARSCTCDPQGSLASLPPKTITATVQVQPGPWCCTGSEVVMNGQS